MAYPAATLWGAGAPRFILSPNPINGRTRSVYSAEIIDMPALALDSPEPQFATVGIGQAEPEILRDDGKIIDNITGFRFQATFAWASLTYAQAAYLARIVSWRRIGSVVCMPRYDATISYRVIPISFEIGHPGGLYDTHSGSITVIGTDVLNDISQGTSDVPAFQPLVY